jgi:hypothetical protein
MSKNGISTDQTLTSEQIQNLKRNDREFVFRYYCDEATQYRHKILRPEEAQLYAQAGLKIGAVYEFGGGAPRKKHDPPHPEDFEVERAERDANIALAQAAAVKQPRGSAIYFAVDYDFADEPTLTKISGYFGRIEEVFRSANGGNLAYALGVYGSGLVCRRIKQERPAVRFAWLADAPGWTESKTYKDWTVKQFAADGTFSGFDYEDCQAYNDFGGFIPKPAGVISAAVSGVAFSAPELVLTPGDAWKGILSTSNTAQTIGRAHQGLSRKTIYQLGAGGSAGDIVAPLTPRCDCSGFICWAMGAPREFPPGSDHWLYTDTIWEGGGDVGARLFSRVPDGAVQPGDLYVYPAPDAHSHGHVAMITLVEGGLPQQILHCSLSNYERTQDAVRITSPVVFTQNRNSRIMRPNYDALRQGAGIKSGAVPQDEITRVPSFEEFHKATLTALHEHYQGRPHAKVRSREAFEEQKRYLLNLYQGVNVKHTFVDSGGQVFDCIPIDQQPALKMLGRPISKPPSLSHLGSFEPRATRAMEIFPPLSPDRKDRYGNAMSCPQGTVAIRRITLEELTRFESLDHFRKKNPRNASKPARRRPSIEAPDVSNPPHEYAHAYEIVDNIGGHSVLNVWSPPVTGDQIFSLSQQWYVAQGNLGVQTAEVGWQVFPQKYGHSKPVLFTYWTADGYQQTGSYNTDAGDFVQYSATHPVGIAIDAISTTNGTQSEIELTFMLSEGNWWLYVNGTDAEHAVGYYPVSLYQNGPMTSNATEIDYGGETVGLTTYPWMGSGAFSKEGYKKAAYQRNIYYFPPSGSTQDANLTESQDWPGSYTITVAHSNDWGEYFFFGGPGGSAPSIEHARPLVLETLARALGLPGGSLSEPSSNSLLNA